MLNIFSDYNRLLYLKPDRLEFYQSNGTNALFEFPKELVSFKEVLDSSELTNNFAKFLEGANLAGNSMLVLISAKLLFEKVFPISEDQAEIAKFVDSVPFDNKSKILLQNKNEKLVSVTNRELIVTLLNSLEKLGVNVTKIVPATLFQIEQNSPLDEASFKIITSQSLVKEADFLHQLFEPTTIIQKNPNDEEELEEGDALQDTDSKNGLKVAIIIISVIILAGLLVYLASTFDLIKLPFVKQKTVSSSPKPSVEASSSAQPSEQVSEVSLSAEVNKEELTVNILNGSASSGQATRVEEILKQLGYTNITTGNFETTSQDTTASYNQKVTTDLKEEIKLELEKIFINLEEKEATEGGQFDIEIVTGRLI